MNMSENEPMNISIIIDNNIHLFQSFEAVYWFGSSLDSNALHNDIDLLLIYNEFRDEINNDVIRIRHELQDICGVPIDLTVLSVAEQENTGFLKKIDSHYVKIK